MWCPDFGPYLSQLRQHQQREGISIKSSIAPTARCLLSTLRNNLSSTLRTSRCSLASAVGTLQRQQCDCVSDLTGHDLLRCWAARLS